MDIDRQSLIHDLNNEISVLSCYLDIIEVKVRKGVSSAEVRGSIDKARSRVHQTCRNLAGLIDKERAIDLRFFLSCRAEQLSREYGIRLSLHGEHPFVIRGNESELSMFVKNIMKNSKEAGAKYLKVFFSEEGVRFEDDGSGIDSTILSLVQKGVSITTKGNGHGIGLSSMRRFSKAAKMNFEIGNSRKGGVEVLLSLTR